MAKLLSGPGERGVLRAFLGALTPPRPAARRLGAAEARARLEALGAAARERDYFEVLGLPRGCTGEEARRAADALAAELDRDLAGPAREAGDPALAALLADARQVALDARDVLGDDALRAAYREGLGPDASSEVADGDRRR